MLTKEDAQGLLQKLLMEAMANANTKATEEFWKSQEYIQWEAEKPERAKNKLLWRAWTGAGRGAKSWFDVDETLINKWSEIWEKEHATVDEFKKEVDQFSKMPSSESWHDGYLNIYENYISDFSSTKIEFSEQSTNEARTMRFSKTAELHSDPQIETRPGSTKLKEKASTPKEYDPAAGGGPSAGGGGGGEDDPAASGGGNGEPGEGGGEPFPPSERGGGER